VEGGRDRPVPKRVIRHCLVEDLTTERAGP